MNSIFENNILSLKKTNPEIAELMLSFSPEGDGHIGVADSKKSGPVPFLKVSGGREIYFHSRIDPEKEAERFAGEADFKSRDFVFVCGFAFAYHCEKIVEQCSEEASVFVVERDAELFYRAICSRDLSKILEKSNLRIFVDPSTDEIENAFKGRSTRKLSIISHRGSCQVYGEYYDNIIRSVKSSVSTRDVNIATLAKFEKSWSANLSRNIRFMISSPGVNSFYGEFSGLSAVVVAAGPSLSYSLDFIKKSLTRSVVIAVDTAYKVLLDNGIEPHFCMAVDPQLINARYFEGTGEVRTVLVADPTVHPAIFRFFGGRVVLTGLAFDLMKWIEDITGHKGEISHGGSVSTNAVDFARRLGVRNIYMVGQDLSFTGGLAHCRGSYLDEQIHNRTFRFRNAQMLNRAQLYSLPGIFFPSVRGRVVRTNQKMVIFKEWFEKQKFDNLINASYDGVRINGIPNEDAGSISLPELRDIHSMIDRIYSLSSAEQTCSDAAGRLIARLGDMRDELTGLIPVLEKAVSLSTQLDELLKKSENRTDQGKVNYILKKLSDTDLYIESMKKTKGMISFSIQRVIHTITEGYDLDDDLNSGERSLFLYEGLLQGVRFNEKVFGNMEYFIKKGGL